MMCNQVLVRAGSSSALGQIAVLQKNQTWFRCVSGLEEYDPLDPGIYPGDPAHYTLISSLTVYGDVNVEVDPPDDWGLVLYRVTSGGPSEWKPPTLNPQTVLTLYLLLFLLMAATHLLVFEPAFAFI